MKEQEERRFIVCIEEGSPHGDLYELEQTTWYHIVDTKTNRKLMTFQEEMEASLSTSTGQWDNYRYFGVREVTITPDENAVAIKYHDGREQIVALPK